MKLNKGRRKNNGKIYNSKRIENKNIKRGRKENESWVREENGRGKEIILKQICS